MILDTILLIFFFSKNPNFTLINIVIIEPSGVAQFIFLQSEVIPAQ